MAWVNIDFHEVLVNSSKHNTDSDHMVSVVAYEITVDGSSLGSFVSLVKQAAGADPADPLEVTLPDGYDGPMDYGAFRSGVEKYYRGAFGPQGGMINIGPKASVTMENVTAQYPMRHSFKVESRT